MKTFSITLLLLLLIAHSCKASSSVTSLTPGGPWSRFYGPKGNPSNADTSFEFTIGQPLDFYITDVLCKGDYFEVFDNGISIGTTPVVPVVGCPAEMTNDPNVAYSDPGFSHKLFVIPPGHHVITIKVYTNYPRGSLGYVRLAKGCSGGSKQFFVPLGTVPQYKADYVCKRKGYKASSLNTGNWNEATTVAYLCFGPNSSGWFGEWDGNNYDPSVVQLNTGSCAPGGAVTAVPKCGDDVKQLVLCQDFNCDYSAENWNCPDLPCNRHKKEH